MTGPTEDPPDGAGQTGESDGGASDDVVSNAAFGDAAGDAADPSHRESQSPARPSWDEAALRDAYGPVRGYFRSRTDEFDRLAGWLRAGRVTSPVDEYLARTVRLALLGGGVGALVGVAVAAWVGLTFLGDFPLVAVAVGVVVILGGAAVGAGVVAGGRYAYPAVVAHRRRRRVDSLLPHVSIFVYALSHGGMGLLDILERVASADEVYGEAAAEFERVVQDVEWFGQDLLSALSRARDETPSEELEAFLDELVTVLETGGDIDTFLRDEARRHLEVAEQQQDRLLSDLETMAEVYIAVVFAGPIFLMVVLLVASFVVPQLLFPMRLLVYVGIPLAILWFGVVLDYLLEPYRQHVGTATSRPVPALDWFRQAIRRVRSSAAAEPAADEEDERYAAYRRSTRRSRLRDLVERPLAAMRARPRYSLLVTVPASTLAVVVLVLAFPDLAHFHGHPIHATTVLFALPFMGVTVPFAYFHERGRRRERTVRSRLPTALSILADANENAVPLSDSFELVADRMSGTLSAELSRVDRDLRWEHDVAGALERFAERTGTPIVDRVVRLLVESLRSTNDLAPVLRIVSDDLQTRNDVRREQRDDMRPYVVIVFLGVMVYLGIVVLFETHFLPVAQDVAKTGASTLRGTPMDVGSLPVDTYRELFFHSALIQAVGNGLLLGKLVDNRVASGAKYAAVLVAIQIVVFLTFV